MLALASAALVVFIALGVAMGTILVHTRHASERFLHGLMQMRDQMDALARELTHAVEKVHEDALRARIVESLGQALDLDEVLARCTEAAMLLPGVTGAHVGISVDGISAGAGAGLDPRAGGSVMGPPDGSRVRAVALSYHYPPGQGAHSAIRSAIAVPLQSGDEQLGFLTVFGRDDEPPVAGAGFQTLEAIARRTESAIERARRRSTGPTPVANDGLTGLGNRYLFHETLALEVARAHRRSRMLAVCVLDVDDFRSASGRVGHLAGDDLLVEIADLLRTTIRSEDIACRIGGDAFAVILPAAQRIDAEGLFAQVQATLRRRPQSLGPTLSLSAGIAELDPADDGVSLYERADRALLRAKQAGKGRAA